MATLEIKPNTLSVQDLLEDESFSTTATANEIEQQEIRWILEALQLRTGQDYSHYRTSVLERRLNALVHHYQVSHYSELISPILHSNSFAHEFGERLLLHVSSLFRDPLVWRALRLQVLPQLSSYHHPTIWIAGCAKGEDVFSLCILLEELGLLSRCRVYATDISSGVIATANKGGLMGETLKESTEGYLQAGGTRQFKDYLITEQQKSILNPALLDRCHFSVHD